MRLIILLSLLVLGCSTTQPVSCPSCPGPTTITVVDSVKVPGSVVYIHDTIIHVVAPDSMGMDIYLAPANGDSWPELQDAIDYCQQNPGHRIFPQPGIYSISKSLVIAKRVGSDYTQSWVDIEGLTNAKDAPSSAVATFVPTFTNAPVICLQQCKGCVIKNIAFKGLYTVPGTLNQIQIDTLSYSAWSDGICTDGTTNPYTAIAIDPFSDSLVYSEMNFPMYPTLRQYYLAGMSRSGSTDIHIEDCAIRNFVVGVMVTPSDQQNGEEIDLLNDHIDYCRSAIAWGQTQSKQNIVYNLQSWGGVYDVFDGNNYGFHHGDGSTAPMIDGFNVAGNTHQLFDLNVNSFPFTAQNGYAENLYKIGAIHGYAGILFTALQIDFQNSVPGVPSPDYYYWGLGTEWEGCQLRLYNNGLPGRLVLNAPANKFNGGIMSLPPFTLIQQPMNGPSSPTRFDNVTMYYSGRTLNTNTYDSLLPSINAIIHILPAFNGWYIHPNAPESVGDLIISNLPIAPTPANSGRLAVFPIGFVSYVNGDTVYLQNIGQNVYDGSFLTVIDTKIKLL